jgi:hypothetical protein
MENVALLGELASADELEELYELDASESDPEDDEDDEEDDDDDEDDDGEIEPEGMPVGSARACVSGAGFGCRRQRSPGRPRAGEYPHLSRYIHKTPVVTWRRIHLPFPASGIGLVHSPYPASGTRPPKEDPV